MSENICAECDETFLPEELIFIKDVYVCATCKPIILQKIDEGHDVNTDVNVKPVGFWVRVCAYFVDALILSPLMVVGIFNALQWKSMALLVAMSVLGTLYRPILHGIYGATPGKMICKIWVRREDGSPISMGQAWLRETIFISVGIIGLISSILIFSASGFDKTFTFLEWGEFAQQHINPVLNIISNVVSCIMFVAMLMVAFTHRKRGLHDKMSGTYCVFKK
ncbi:MAG: hypothetical protein COA79_08285 [Planctomycetota bacterium]|nr:MAG: hypothetical protein COA79_08285 [Planctomycetota bacterium]